MHANGCVYAMCLIAVLMISLVMDLIYSYLTHVPIFWLFSDAACSLWQKLFISMSLCIYGPIDTISTSNFKSYRRNLKGAMEILQSHTVQGSILSFKFLPS